MMTPRVRKISSLVLLVGGAVVALSLAPKAPVARSVDFRLEGETSDLVRLDVAWTRAGEEKTGDPVLGSSFRFERGQAPKIVRTTVRLADGSYALDVTLERVDRTESMHRNVTLSDSDQITIPLH